MADVLTRSMRFRLGMFGHLWWVVEFVVFLVSPLTGHRLQETTLVAAIRVLAGRENRGVLRASEVRGGKNTNEIGI
jgi:hypothetical protein